MKKTDQWSGLFLWILSGFICWGSALLPYGNIRDPGPGFLPMWLGIILAAMSLALILKATWEKKGSKKMRDLWETKIRWAKTLLALLFLFLFAFLLDIVGFLIVSFLFLVPLFRFIDPQPWKSVIGWALVGSVSFYLVFEVWLRLRFPKGFLSF